MSEVMELTEVPVGQRMVKFNVTNAEIERLKAEYLPLTINGLEDKEGLKRVYEARQEVKRTRVALTKYAKEMREDAQAWAKKVISEEKRVVGELETIEAHLQAEEDKIEAEKERIRKEAEDRENARMQERLDALSQYGFAADYAQLKALDDDSFKKLLVHAEAQWQQEQERKAEEERLAQLERDRIEAERKELEELRAKQAEQQRIIDEQNRKIREQQEAENKRRWGVLAAMGLVWNGEAFVLNDINVHWSDVICWNDEEFTTYTTDIQAEIERRRADEATQREAELQKAREDAAERGRIEERARIEREAELKKEAEEKARKAAERKAAALYAVACELSPLTAETTEIEQRKKADKRKATLAARIEALEAKKEQLQEEKTRADNEAAGKKAQAKTKKK